MIASASRGSERYLFLGFFVKRLGNYDRPQLREGVLVVAEGEGRYAFLGGSSLACRI
jgi:hypothetical protein